MSDDLSNRGGSDRKRINVNQEYEVRGASATAPTRCSATSASSDRGVPRRLPAGELLGGVEERIQAS